MGGSWSRHLTEWAHSVCGDEDPPVEVQQQSVAACQQHRGARHGGGYFRTIPGLAATDAREPSM